MAMSHAGRAETLWLSALLAGCSIEPRIVEERGAVAGASAHAGENAQGGAPGQGGAATGGKPAGGAATGGKPAHEIGVELDPIGAGGTPPGGPVRCQALCAAGSCLASTLTMWRGDALNVSVRDGWVYWMDATSVWRTKSDDNAPLFVIGGLQLPSRVVVNANDVFFGSHVGLWKVPRDAAGLDITDPAAALLITYQSYKARLVQLAIDSVDVYWATPPAELPVRLQRTATADGETVELARLPQGEALPLGLAVDDTDLYFTRATSLSRVPKAGGPIEVLAPIVGKAPDADRYAQVGLALDADYAYFDAGAALRRAPKAGGDVETLFNLQGDDQLQGLVVDLDYVYFATMNGEIGRIPKAGGARTTLTSGEANPLLTAADDCNLYWVAQSSVRKLAKGDETL